MVCRWASDATLRASYLEDFVGVLNVVHIGVVVLQVRAELLEAETKLPLFQMAQQCPDDKEDVTYIRYIYARTVCVVWSDVGDLPFGNIKGHTQPLLAFVSDRDLGEGEFTWSAHVSLPPITSITI